MSDEEITELQDEFANYYPTSCEECIYDGALCREAELYWFCEICNFEFE